MGGVDEIAAGTGSVSGTGQFELAEGELVGNPGEISNGVKDLLRRDPGEAREGVEMEWGHRCEAGAQGHQT